MGWSFIITFADGRTVQKHDEEPRNPANTVNVAEYRGLRDVEDRVAAADAAALLDLLVRRGLVAGEAGSLPALRCAATPLDGTHFSRFLRERRYGDEFGMVGGRLRTPVSELKAQFHQIAFPCR